MALISSSRYFTQATGAASVATTSHDLGSGQFSVTVELSSPLTFTGTSSEVMDALATLANHFSDAREQVLNHLIG